MPIYKQTTEITNIDDLLSSVERDIEEVYFGDKQVFTVWAEYDGTLPAQYSANGDYLADYRIYGATGGVGDRTENLFDVSDYFIGITNFITKRIALEPNTTYTMSSNCPTYNVGALIAIGNVGESFTTSNNGVYPNHPISRTADSNGELVIGLRTNGSSYTPADYETMLTPGSTAPAEYVPFGYEVDIATKSRNIMPSAAAEVKTENGITISCDGRGRYHISGTAAIQTSINFDITPFTIPTSVGAGGNGTFSLFNNFSNSHVVLFFYNNDYAIDSWVCVPANRTHSAYNLMSGKVCNKIKLQIDKGASINGVIAPMFTEDGTLPTIYQPYSKTVTPIYIGSSPLNAYEYIDYASGKIVRRTDNLVPSAPAFETTDRGITISTDGDGVYRISGTADSRVEITLPIPQFSEPLSVAEGGNGAMNFFNAPMNGVTVEMKYDNNTVRRIELSSSYESAAYTYAGNIVQNVYVEITGGQTVNGSFSLMITDTGSIPQTYDPYVAPVDPPVPLPALPTVDGTTITDYAGQSAAPTEFYAKYRKGRYI